MKNGTITPEKSNAIKVLLIKVLYDYYGYMIDITRLLIIRVTRFDDSYYSALSLRFHNSRQITFKLRNIQNVIQDIFETNKEIIIVCISCNSNL